MNEQTELDRVHAAMIADASDDPARLRFYERLADTEFFLALTREFNGETISPQIYPVADQKYVLVFDREERLVGFSGKIVPYAALSGRAIAGMLGGQGIGLAVNLGDDGRGILIPATSVDWLLATLAESPDQHDDRPARFCAPSGLSDDVLQSLNTKLALATGLAVAAYLVRAEYVSGRAGHLLAIIDALPGSEPALAQSISEALTFSGMVSGAFDVAFFTTDDPICATLARVGLKFELPEQPQKKAGTTAPGMDPDRPPILR